MLPVESNPILIDKVYQRLLEAIGDCTLAPGERIRQGELAERLGVSRQPVSHALHLLKRQGLVIESGRKGLEVAPIEPTRIRQLYEVRAALDGAAARLAAERAATDRSGRLALERAVKAGPISASTPLPKLLQLDMNFHVAIYRLSGNAAVEETIAPLWPHLRRAMATALAAADYPSRFWAEHTEIADFILQGDAAAAEHAASAHALGAGRTTAERMSALVDAA